MKFSIKYTLEDYNKAQKLFYKTSKSGWVVRWFIPLIGLGLVSIIISSWVNGNEVYSKNLDILFLVLGVFYIIFPFLYVKLHTLFLFKRSKFLHSENTFEIDENEIKITNELTSAITKWDIFIRYGIDDETIILMATPRTMYMLPRRAIQSEEEWVKLVELVKTKVKV